MLGGWCSTSWPSRTGGASWTSCARASVPSVSSSPSCAVSQPAVSKHLRVLREAGLVEVRGDAQRRLYSAAGGAAARARRLAGALSRAVGRTRSTPSRRTWTENPVNEGRRRLEQIGDRWRLRVSPPSWRTTPERVWRALTAPEDLAAVVPGRRRAVRGRSGARADVRQFVRRDVHRRGAALRAAAAARVHLGPGRAALRDRA